MDHIKLVVKAPNQKIPDVSTSIDPEWTVRDLKKHLSVEYPSKPSPPDQRLIYSGHLMRDDQRLNDVFHIGEESKDDVYTIHLVCRPIVSGGESGSSQTNLTLSSQLQTTSGTSSRRGSQQMGNPTSSGNQPTTFPTMVPNSLGIETPPLTMPMMMSNPLMTSPMIPMMWTPEQIQAMYSQFVTQWQANPTVIPTISTFPTTTVPFVNHPSTSSTSTTQQQSPETVEQLIRQRHGVVSNVQQQQPQLQQPPVREEVNQPAAANVAPGFNNAVIGGPAAVVEDDDEVNNRDWLDWFYWASRAIVLFSIVYFYSSFTRFILVLATAALMYLYQIGAFGRPGEGLFGGGEEDNEAEEVDDPPEGQRAGQQPHPAEGEQQPQAPQGVRRNSGQNGQQPVTPESEQDRLSGLRLCWVVISSLFTSLIPEGPGGAAGNFN